MSAGTPVTLPGRVMTAQPALHEQQRQPVLANGLCQLLLGGAVLAEALQQLQPGLTVSACQPVQQAGLLEVHAGILSQISRFR